MSRMIDVTTPRPSGRGVVTKPVFATLEQALVIRQLGTLTATDQADLKNAITQILS